MLRETKMGWSFTYGTDRAEIIAEVTRGWGREDGSGSQTLKHCCRGNVLFAVHENTNKSGETYRFIGVHLLQKSSDGWGYKSMAECEGPNYIDCPVSYIELAEEMPPVEGLDRNSVEWREKVRAVQALRSRKYAVGQIVESVRPLNFGGGQVSRFKVVKLPRGGRSLYCRDAEGNVEGLLRLQKTDVKAVEPNDRRALVAATKEKE
jgi:hypothetical protein